MNIFSIFRESFPASLEGEVRQLLLHVLITKGKMDAAKAMQLLTKMEDQQRYITAFNAYPSVIQTGSNSD